MLLWNALAVGSFTLNSSIWLFSLLLISLLAGDLFLYWVLRHKNQFSNLPTKLLLGIICVNTVAVFMALTLPFGLAWNWFLLMAIVGALWIKYRWPGNRKVLLTANNSEALLLVFSPLAIIAWNQDLLRPIEIGKEFAVIRSWEDIYFHLAQINNFALSNGIFSITDVQAAGLPAHIYHIASYLLPATLVSTAGLSTLEAYSSLYVPIGIFLTALATYALINSLFGKWPALVASLALLMLPDASQQGFGNQFFSYHWMQVIAPAALYGVSVAATAFMFLFVGCQEKKYKLIILGYIFAGLVLFYKAQIFFAISFPAFIFPVLFISGLTLRLRLFLCIALTTIYFGVLTISQSFQGVPVILLNGSGLSTYGAFVFNTHSYSFVRELGKIMFTINSNFFIEVIPFIVLITICTFGVYLFIYISLIKYFRNNFDFPVWIFPSLVLIIYLIMATFLALDTRNIGMPEELLHRHFVWAYFIILIWGAGGLYHRYFGDSIPSSNSIRLCLLAIVTLMLISPIYFGREIQTYKQWNRGYQSIPLCQLESAKFITKNSNVNDIIQDSVNDPSLILSALSERRIFAIDTGGIRQPLGIQSRLRDLADLRELKELIPVEIFMKNNLIKWYLVNPRAEVQWAELASEHKVFECGGYKIYNFH